ncbi:hypothetical protein EXIGLDRAFT_730088 [Exidia glandulosa HHB12029]|uniref:Lipoprotein n=1 Tax=Exidia glandulosa HHB12029 TaxID=1314781 RepID=A0A165LD30_EXIGL|nr:hypothetical protein EXIGLDRAFT_730088 [Exidia glandulosa HHB12029]
MRPSNPLHLLRRVVALVTGCFVPPGNDQLDATTPASAQPAPKTFRNSYDTGTTAAPPDPAPTDSPPSKAVDTLLAVPGDVGRDTPRPSSSDGRVAEYFAPHDALITASAPDLHALPSPSDALAPSEADVNTRSKSTDALPTREDSLPISIDSTDSGITKGKGGGHVQTGTTTSSGTMTGKPPGGVIKPSKH